MEATAAEDPALEVESMPVKGFCPALATKHQARWQKWAVEDVNLPCVEACNSYAAALLIAMENESILTFAGLAMLLHRATRFGRIERAIGTTESGESDPHLADCHVQALSGSVADSHNLK